MLKNDFEKYMKDNLESAKMDWDKEAMWDNIAEALPEEERRRKPFWLWFFALGGFLVLGGLIVSQWQKGTHVNDKLVSSNVPVAESISVPTQMEKKSIDASELDIEKRESTNINDLDNTINILENTSPELKITHDAKGESIELTQEPTAQSGSQVQKKFNSNFESEIKNSNNHLNNAAGNIVDNKQKSTVLFDNIFVEAEKNKSNSNISESKITASSSKKLLAFNMLELPLAALSYNEIRDISISPQFSYLKTAFIKPVKKSIRKNLLLTTGYGLTKRSINGPASESNLLLERDQSEKVLEKLALDISYRHFLSQNLFAQVGVGYQRINERMDFIEEEISSKVIQSDSAQYYVSYLGQREYVVGEREETTIERTQFAVFNEHHFVTVPLQLGWYAHSGGFSYGASAGPHFNIYQKYSGDLINSDFKVDNGVEVNDFDSSLISHISGGIFGEFHLRSSFSIFGGIYYTKAVGDFTLGNQLRQSYDSLDLKLGLVFNL